MKSVNALFSQWPPSCRRMVRGKWYEEKPSKLPSNCHGNNANRASVLSSKHRYQIPITEDFELLGITLDEKLKFETLVARVCRGVSRQVAQVYVWKRCFPLKQERISSFLSIFPHFNYCSETWHYHSTGASAKLEKVNERAIRVVFYVKHTHHQELLIKIKLPSLTNERLTN